MIFHQYYAKIFMLDQSSKNSSKQEGSLSVSALNISGGYNIAFNENDELLKYLASILAEVFLSKEYEQYKKQKRSNIL